MKTKEEKNIIIAKVIEMITIAKTNKTYNLEKFVRNPYKGFNTGKEVVRKLPLGTEKDFMELLQQIEDDISLSNLLKEEILTVLWTYRGMQLDANDRRYERLEQQKIGLTRTSYPYNDKSGDEDVLEDAQEMTNLFSYLNNDNYNDDTKEKVEEILSKLSEEERFLLVEHFMNQRTNVSIAKEIGLNESSIRRRIDSILKKIRSNY